MCSPLPAVNDKSLISRNWSMRQAVHMGRIRYYPLHCFWYILILYCTLLEYWIGIYTKWTSQHCRESMMFSKWNCDLQNYFLSQLHTICKILLWQKKEIQKLYFGFIFTNWGILLTFLWNLVYGKDDHCYSFEII